MMEIGFLKVVSEELFNSTMILYTSKQHRDREI